MLEKDAKGNLYLYKTALLCKNDIIKRLISGKYQLEDPGIIGKCHIQKIFVLISGVKFPYIYLEYLHKNLPKSKEQMRCLN